MNDQTFSTSALEPRQEPSFSEDRFKIAFWIGRYESHLYLNATGATYERYSRILTKFYTHFLGSKQFTYSFLRSDFEDYRDDRLKEGASPVTVAMELSVLRGFWRWMLRMGSEGVMFNPVLAVKVKSAKPRKAKKPPEMHPMRQPTDSGRNGESRAENG